MAEQHFPQTRPFMSKETFDEVSFEMWGRSDYDYHASYIASRMEWYDDDIREEALYASGMAYGLRLAALERTSQPIRHQNGYRDQSSALSDEGGCQFGCTSQCDPRYGEHYCYASHLSQTMAQTPTSQSSRPVLPVSGVARTPSESAALQRQASMFNDGSAPRQDSRDYANGYYGIAPQSPYILPRETEVPGMKLSGNLKAVYRPGQGIVAVSGAPTSSDGSSVRPSPSDSPESHLRTEIPLRQKPQSATAGRNDKSVRNTTTEKQSGFELDDAYADTSIPSSKTESSKREDSETDNEDWVDLGMK